MKRTLTTLETHPEKSARFSRADEHKGGRACLARRRQRGRKRLLPKGAEVQYARHTQA